MRMCNFQAQNTPICPEQNILVQTIIITFIYLLKLFIGQNLLMSLVSFIHAYLHAKNQSQIFIY